MTYAKIHDQILDSTLAEDYQTRHLFMDLCVIANQHGIVDKTAAAIARRLNMPLDLVIEGIQKLSLPDPESRSPDEDGRRLVPVDPERSWGWRVVNYPLYRDKMSDEERRIVQRDMKRQQRAKNRPIVLDSPGQSWTVSDSPTMSPSQTQVQTQTQVQPPTPLKGEALSDDNAGGVVQKPKRTRKKKQVDEAAAISELPIPEILDTFDFRNLWNEWRAERIDNGKPLTLRAAKIALTELETYGHDGALASLKSSIIGHWQGVFPPSGRRERKVADIEPYKARPHVELRPMSPEEIERMEFNRNVYIEEKELAAKKWSKRQAKVREGMRLRRLKQGAENKG